MKLIQIGVGYIGIGTMLYFTKADVECIGIDLDTQKVALLNRNILPQKDLESWLKFDITSLLQRMKVFDNYSSLYKEADVDAISIAVPTEKNGMPYFDILMKVIEEIKKSPLKDTLVIIESTVTPGVSDKYIKPNLKNFVIAPRRDWFTDENKTIATLPRIVGGNTEENTQKAITVLSKVCKNLHACNYQEAELVKAIENSIRHIGAVYATQLAFAYPNLDIRKILELAGTKWNIATYYPNSFGTSGYCIPISSKYVKMGADNPEILTILDAVLGMDFVSSQLIANLIKQSQPISIGILGMAYLGDIKVHVECGCLRLLKYFRQTDDIRINDPLYTAKEIHDISQRDTFSVPDDLDKFDVIIVTAGHSFYKTIDKEVLIEKTKNCKYILDNSENRVWEGIDFQCPYAVTGRPNWLNIFQTK